MRRGTSKDPKGVTDSSLGLKRAQRAIPQESDTPNTDPFRGRRTFVNGAAVTAADEFLESPFCGDDGGGVGHPQIKG